MAEKLVQLLIVPDGELEMTGDDTSLLVVAGSVASQLENLSCEVLEDGSEVDGSAGTDTLSVVALAEQTVDTTDRESQTGLGGTAGLRCRVSQMTPDQQDAPCWKARWASDASKDTTFRVPPTLQICARKT